MRIRDWFAAAGDSARLMKMLLLCFGLNLRRTSAS
jgi:hypothetical protein